MLLWEELLGISRERPDAIINKNLKKNRVCVPSFLLTPVAFLNHVGIGVNNRVVVCMVSSVSSQ